MTGYWLQPCAKARDHLRAVAGRILDPDHQRSFLENLPENVGTLALARTLLSDVPEGFVRPRAASI